jgi:hypothetical protein
MTTWRRVLVVLVGLAPVLCLDVRGQAPTNLETYQTLALRCLAGVPDTTARFVLDAPAQMPYLRTALTEAWRRDGRTLFFADSSLHTAAPRLTYTIEDARVGYARARRRQLDRTVVLALHYIFIAVDGRLLGEARCRETFTDTIRRADRPALESETYPETQGALPRAGWTRRYLEPAVLAAATAITVYLFFNLRSDRSTDGG